MGRLCLPLSQHWNHIVDPDLCYCCVHVQIEQARPLMPEDRRAESENACRRGGKKGSSGKGRDGEGGEGRRQAAPGRRRREEAGGRRQRGEAGGRGSRQWEEAGGMEAGGKQEGGVGRR